MKNDKFYLTLIVALLSFQLACFIMAIISAPFDFRHVIIVLSFGLLYAAIFSKYMKGKFMNKSNKLVLQYVLDNEMDDFAENPSNSHVYYHAVRVHDGINAAKQVLKEAIEKLRIKPFTMDDIPF